MNKGEIYIRPAKISDAIFLNEMRTMVGVFENILGVPSEQIQKSEDYLKNIGTNSHVFVACTLNDKKEEIVIGTSTLAIPFPHRMRHVGSIAIMVNKNYHGLGVGSKLMESMLDMADNWLMLIRVELTVFVDNEKAINLYKKYGFEIEGTKRKSVIRNGEYIDEFVMGRVK